jgi:hypothetical protein
MAALFFLFEGAAAGAEKRYKEQEEVDAVGPVFTLLLLSPSPCTCGRAPNQGINLRRLKQPNTLT